MMKWTLACAGVVVAGFLAIPAVAQESTPAPTTGTTVIQSTNQTQRGGFLGRFRSRRGQMTTTSVSQPTTNLKTMPSATPSGVQQAQAVETTSVPMQTTQSRQGILGRLRARMGR